MGEVDFGEAASLEVDDIILPWYDYLFKNAQNEFSTGKPIKIFVMGTNEWRSEDEWPLARAVNSKYFLHSGGKANSLHGDGTISTAASRAETPDQYVSSIPHIRYLPLAGLYVAMKSICRQGLATKGQPKPAMTFWSTRRLYSRMTSKSQDQSPSNFTPALPR